MPRKTKSTAKTKSAKTSRLTQLRQWVNRTTARTPHNPHHAFRLTRPRLYVTGDDLRGAWRLQIESWRFIWRYKRILLGLGLLFTLLSFLLVGGISQLNYVDFKDAAMEFTGGDFGAITTAATLFLSALTGGLSTPATDAQQFLAAVLMLLFWLAIIWAARMLHADKDITLRDALYNSGAPIISTLVMLSIVAFQLIPAAVGVFGYSAAITGGWLNGGVESMAFAMAAVLLCLLSLYFVVSSITGLVVVTLPGTYPWQALREARAMVMNRRWGIVLRILALVLHAVLLWAVVLLPIFLLDNWLRFDWLPLVPVFVQALMGITLVYTSVYAYKLYRSLL